MCVVFDDDVVVVVVVGGVVVNVVAVVIAVFLSARGATNALKGLNELSERYHSVLAVCTELVEYTRVI